MEKTIKMSLELAKKLKGTSPEMDALIAENFTEEELRMLKSWEDLGYISGWAVDDYSRVSYYSEMSASSRNKNIFATENQARSALAMAQLSQLMKDVNGDWKPKWNDKEGAWFITCSVNLGTAVSYTYNRKEFLAFKTEEKAKEFLNAHRELIQEFHLMYE